MQLEFFRQPSINDLYDPLLGFMNTPFWLTGGSCKKSTTNKETPQNGDEFCMIPFNARSKCPKVSLTIIDISSIIKTFRYWYCFPSYKEIHHLAFYTCRISILT